MSRLTIVVSETDRPAALRISLDGMVLGEAAWNVPTPVDPGVHDVVASAPGTVQRTFSVSIGPQAETASVVVVLEKEPPVSVALVSPVVASARVNVATAAALSSAPSSDGNVDLSSSTLAATNNLPGPGPASASRLRIAAYMFGAGGATGLLIGGIAGWWAYTNWSRFKAECPREDACNWAGQRYGNAAQTAARVTDIAVVAGVLALTAGGSLLYVSRRMAQEPAAGEHSRDLTFTPTISSRGVGLALGGGW
ncbi:MAG: hypothetical protein H7X95_10710 [Deltaproteobacteria bacterium]|nr:hypothetical protein [Deltaproteobacteria bacterium]